MKIVCDTNHAQVVDKKIHLFPERIEREILQFLSPAIRQLLLSLSPVTWQAVQEIRLRLGSPLMLVTGLGDMMIDGQGRVTHEFAQARMIEIEDMSQTIEMISQSSLYAIEEELRQGYVTLPGGHRVGMVGKTVLSERQIKTMKHISALNIRISRQVIGAANKVMPEIIGAEGKDLYHTLLISPPQCGKTTLLRDMVRQLSNGIKDLNFQGIKVGLVDERSEIASCYHGFPQNDVGVRTDVLDGCPKAQGMMMLVRSMSPQVIATDEIGREEDALALEEVLNAGVKIVTTVHGSDLDEVSRRPVMAAILHKQIFERIIILGKSKGVGTIEQIITL